MAHSNRAKLKDARGGLTRNQLRKSKHANSSQSSNRLQETINWLAQLEEKKRVKSTSIISTKIVRFSKSNRTNRRRRVALSHLEEQVRLGAKRDNVWEEGYTLLNDKDKERIKEEIDILKKRIAA